MIESVVGLPSSVRTEGDELDGLLRSGESDWRLSIAVHGMNGPDGVTRSACDADGGPARPTIVFTDRIHLCG